MHGLVVRKTDSLIVTVIPDVIKVVGNSIIGRSASAEEINLEEATIYVVDLLDPPEEQKALAKGTKNHVAAFTEMTAAEKREEDEQRIMDLELALAALLSK